MRARQALGLPGALGRVTAAMERRLAAAVGDLGVSAADLSALAVIARIAGPTGVSQVAIMRELGLGGAAVSARVARLEAAGLVTRRRDINHQSEMRVALTASGRDVVDAAEPRRRANEDTLLAPLSSAEREALAGILTKLEAHLLPAHA